MSLKTNKILIIVVEVILFLSLGCFAIGYTAKEMVINVITDEAIDDAIAHRVMDIVFEEFPEANTYQLGNVQEAITKNPAIKKITLKYIDVMCSTIAKDEVFHSPNIDEEIKQLVDENMEVIEKYIGVKISESQRVEIYQKLNEQKADIEETLEQVTYSLVSDSYQNDIRSTLVKTFMAIDSVYFKLTCIVLIVMNILGLFYLKKPITKPILQISITLMGVGSLLAFIVPNLFEKLGMDITNRFLGRTMIVDFASLKNFGYVYCLIGLILGLVYFIFKRKLNNIEVNDSSFSMKE
uniref:hypothetical protein n=1 Tax=Thomasclavelia ramosa TaxID=1547 RepID=UPI00402A62C8